MIRSIREIAREMKNTIKIRASKCLSSAFGYFSEYINQNKPKKSIEKNIAQNMKQYKNSACTISNLEITEESDFSNCSPMHLRRSHIHIK